MKTNVKRPAAYTHEGGVAHTATKLNELRRTLLSCLLWEKNFYESGISVADRIKELAKSIKTSDLINLAIEARKDHHLRHAPLLILLELISRGGAEVSEAIYQVINRPDEITELVSLYWLRGKRPLSKQMKLGLGKALSKFDEYQLAKWNRPGNISLRDVMFLVHAKPIKGSEDLYKRIANNELKLPDTWESRMAGGQDKKEVFTDLLKRKKLGYMALLRNLRGMIDCGVNQNLVKDAIANPSKNILPFRFISAAKHAPKFERELDEAMVKSLSEHNKLPGRTALLIDVSGSMTWPLSDKSELTRLDAACGLAILANEISEDIAIYSFSHTLVECPSRSGMALKDAINNSQPNRGTYLWGAYKMLLEIEQYDRLIVFTDEQTSGNPMQAKGKCYMVNVSTNKNGVSYGLGWNHIDGFSESIIKYIQCVEAAALF